MVAVAAGGIGMDDSIRFAIVNLVPGQTPSVCPLCTTNPALFEYTRSGPDTSESLGGKCCLSCIQRLLGTMQELAIAKWTRNQPVGLAMFAFIVWWSFSLSNLDG